MIVHQPRKRPAPWPQWKGGLRFRWLKFFLALEYGWEWVAFFLSNWVFLEVLEYLGSFSVLIAVIFYFADSGNRVKQRHYQAWQVINTAQGKGGSGGRIDALQELNSDHVALVGIDLTAAFLQGVKLGGADLHRATLNAADMREAELQHANLEDSDMRSTNLRKALLMGTNFRDADLSDADLTDADLRNADLSGSNLDRADLTGARLEGARISAKTSLAETVGADTVRARQAQASPPSPR